MAGKAGIEKRTEELLGPILDSGPFVLWDVEYVKEAGEYYLRVYIDKEGGIMIDDCVDVSRKLSDALDADDFIEDAYTLEVSSPGLGRKLVKVRPKPWARRRHQVLQAHRRLERNIRQTCRIRQRDRHDRNPSGQSPARNQGIQS